MEEDKSKAQRIIESVIGTIIYIVICSLINIISEALYKRLNK